MKTIFKLALAALFMFSYSCSQELELNSENLEAVNAKAENAKNATRAWRGKFSNVADLTQSIVACVPVSEGVVLTTNIISGNMTHLGKIQEGSFGRPQDGTCFLTGPNSVRVIYNVNYIGAHGDEIITEEDVTIILDFDADPNGLVGTFENTKDENGNPIPIKIIDGTGRFEGATGELLFKDASFGPSASGDGSVISTWRLIGEITY